MNKDTLNAYFISSKLSIEYMQSKVHKDFQLFLEGKKEPTFPQVVKMANAMKIPAGLLLLNKPIYRESLGIQFRTLSAEKKEHQSSELQDTIAFIKNGQAFLAEETENELPFIGKFSYKDDIDEVATYIRKTLNIRPDYFQGNAEKNLKFLREKINSIGVFVFFNGKFNDNAKRPLNVEEFRGFVLLNKKAPIIFINQRDAKNAQLFTLIHELVHIFIGEEEIYGLSPAEEYNDRIETFVNKVTAEILVPDQLFKEKAKNGQDKRMLAGHFGVSEFVIIRKLLDNKFINKREYDMAQKELREGYEKNIASKGTNKPKGGSYKNNTNYRIDPVFFRYVENAINTNNISYTDAYSLLGVNYKGYKILKEAYCK